MNSTDYDWFHSYILIWNFSMVNYGCFKVDSRFDRSDFRRGSWFESRSRQTFFLVIKLFKKWIRSIAITFHQFASIEIFPKVNSDSFEADFHLDRSEFDYKDVRGSNPRPVKHFFFSESSIGSIFWIELVDFHHFYAYNIIWFILRSTFSLLLGRFSIRSIHVSFQKCWRFESFPPSKILKCILIRLNFTVDSFYYHHFYMFNVV